MYRFSASDLQSHAMEPLLPPNIVSVSVFPLSPGETFSVRKVAVIVQPTPPSVADPPTITD